MAGILGELRGCVTIVIHLLPIAPSNHAHPDQAATARRSRALGRIGIDDPEADTVRWYGQGLPTGV